MGCSDASHALIGNEYGIFIQETSDIDFADNNRAQSKRKSHQYGSSGRLVALEDLNDVKY